MCHKRALEIKCAQADDVMLKIENALACRGKTAISIAVFGMGHDEIGAEQVDRLRDDAALVFQCLKLEKICGIEDDIEAWAFEMIEQASRFGGRVHNIGEFRLDAERDMMFLCNGKCNCH